ncbi:metal ABC transporter substrate-binding protein [Spirulina major]|uniref:metal ABC transporter substrate-binding protein n=1 Tax=Spirulina major TaxID=270636 RepID=UPI0009353A64|nr:metal ABC transporter substrate-binding protein [Spirulina major]
MRFAVWMTLGSLLFAGCTTPAPDSQDSAASASDSSPDSPAVTVVVSSDILCDLTEQVMGATQETTDLTCLMGPDQDPHTYATTPSDRRAIAQAQLFFYDGYNLTPTIAQLADSAETGVKTVAVFEMAVPNPLMFDHDHNHDHDHGHEDEHGAHDHEEPEHEDHGHEGNDQEKETQQPDPHVWHDVEQAIAAVEVIAAELSAIAPQHRDTYARNADQFTQTLTTLDTWIGEQIATIPADQRILVTTHASFNYFVAAYGLTRAEALQGLSTEDAPSAATLKRLVEQIQATQVPTVFPENIANNTVLDTVTREAGVKSSATPLLTGSRGSLGSYVDMMVSNTCAIATGLGGQCQDFAPPNPTN